MGPTRCQGLSRAPLSSAPSLWREPAQRGGGPGLRAWKGSWAPAGMGPGPQAHHGLRVSLLNRVPPEFCVPVVLGRLPLQSHIEAPRLCNLDILGRTWLICRRQTQVEAHASDSTSRGRQAPGAPLPARTWPAILGRGSGLPREAPGLQDDKRQPRSGTGGAWREAPGPRTDDLQHQLGLVLHVLHTQRHLVGARVGAARGPDEQDGVGGAVADADLLARQRPPLLHPGHLRPGLALQGSTAQLPAWPALPAPAPALLRTRECAGTGASPTWKGMRRFTGSPTFFWMVWRRCLGSCSRGRSVGTGERLGGACRPGTRLESRGWAPLSSCHSAPAQRSQSSRRHRLSL